MLSVIGVDESEHWDNVVSSFPNASVFYRNRYAKACKIRGEGEPLLFYYDDGETRAINVVVKRDIAKTSHFAGLIPDDTFYDLSSPYGYGGFEILGQNHKKVYHYYDDYCQNKGFVSDFVRFNLFSGARGYYSGTAVARANNIVCSLEPSLSDIEADFDRKVRKNLRRAKESGLRIEVDDTGARMDDFLEIYWATMERANASQLYFFSKEYFNAINSMLGYCVYFHVLLRGKVISTELVLYDGANCYSFLGGTDAEFFDVRPNDFLKYHVIKWGKEKGLRRFVLGGGYGEDDGIYRFKKSFSPNGVIQFYTGHQVFDQKKYDMLVKLRTDVLDDAIGTDFFPRYRRIVVS